MSCCYHFSLVRTHVSMMLMIMIMTTSIPTIDITTTCTNSNIHLSWNYENISHGISPNSATRFTGQLSSCCWWNGVISTGLLTSILKVGVGWRKLGIIGMVISRGLMMMVWMVSRKRWRKFLRWGRKTTRFDLLIIVNTSSSSSSNLLLMLNTNTKPKRRKKRWKKERL